MLPTMVPVTVIFTPEGKYIKKYSCSVSKLAGIALDEEGHSFVAENYYYSGSYTTTYGSLSIFNPYQQCIQTLKKFEYAKGVAIDKEGYFYVTSAGDKTVYKY